MSNIIKNKKKRKLNDANAKLTKRSSQQVPDNSSQRVCAIDFDGTLAKQLTPHNPKVAGPPIPRSVKLVKKWMKDNERIVIFTSRVSPSTHNSIQIRYARKLISAWCKEYLGKSFPITSDKAPQLEIWDNKAHRVETNTGRVLANRDGISVSIGTNKDNKVVLVNHIPSHIYAERLRRGNR